MLTMLDMQQVGLDSLKSEADAATCSAGGQLVCEKHWTSDNSEV